VLGGLRGEGSERGGGWLRPERVVQGLEGVIKGEMSPHYALMIDLLKFEGNVARLWPCSNAALLMAKIATSIETVFPDEMPPRGES